MTLYTDLGVDPAADRDEIAAAHRRAAKQHHPDHGGDREQFERVQRAWLVLRDPDKRARYDATGEADTAARNPMAEFAEIIVPAFDAALNEAADRLERVDIIAATRAKLKQSDAQMGMQVAQAKGMKGRFEKALKRLRHDGDGVDIIGNVLRDRIRGIGQQIDAMEAQRVRIRDAGTLLEVYGWEVVQNDLRQFDLGQIATVMQQPHSGWRV